MRPCVAHRNAAQRDVVIAQPASARGLPAPAIPEKARSQSTVRGSRRFSERATCVLRVTVGYAAAAKAAQTAVRFGKEKVLVSRMYSRGSNAAASTTFTSRTRWYARRGS